MKRIETKKVYRKAWDKFGTDAQLMMLMEECAELIQATSKVIRQRKSKTSCWRNFIEEIADVEIMIDQVKVMVDYENIQKRVDTEKHDKMLKLKELVK